MVFIYVSKMPDSQDEQNEMHLHELSMSKIQFLGKVPLKIELFLCMSTWFVFSSLLRMLHMTNED